MCFQCLTETLCLCICHIQRNQKGSYQLAVLLRSFWSPGVSFSSASASFYSFTLHYTSTSLWTVFGVFKRCHIFVASFWPSFDCQLCHNFTDVCVNFHIDLISKLVITNRWSAAQIGVLPEQWSGSSISLNQSWLSHDPSSYRYSSTANLDELKVARIINILVISDLRKKDFCP